MAGWKSIQFVRDDILINMYEGNYEDKQLCVECFRENKSQVRFRSSIIEPDLEEDSTSLTYIHIDRLIGFSGEEFEKNIIKIILYKMHELEHIASGRDLDHILNS